MAALTPEFLFDFESNMAALSENELLAFFAKPLLAEDLQDSPV